MRDDKRDITRRDGGIYVLHAWQSLFDSFASVVYGYSHIVLKCDVDVSVVSQSCFVVLDDIVIFGDYYALRDAVAEQARKSLGIQAIECKDGECLFYAIRDYQGLPKKTKHNLDMAMVSVPSVEWFAATGARGYITSPFCPCEIAEVFGADGRRSENYYWVKGCLEDIKRENRS